MRKGCSLLKDTASLDLLPAHKTAVDLLYGKLDRTEKTKLTHGGNLFLDALTWHKSESERLASVFKL